MLGSLWLCLLVMLAACGGGLNQQPNLESELADLAVSHELNSLHGKTVSAPIRVFVNAHSSTREVRFHLNDSKTPTLTDTSSPFDYTLDAVNGNYSITAFEVRPSGRVTELGRATFRVENKAPTVTSFTATPNSITAGASVTLSWNVADAGSIRIDQGVGTVTGTSTTVSPAATTTYTLTATNAVGSTTATTTVTVTQPALPTEPEPTPPPSEPEPEPTPPPAPTPPSITLTSPAETVTILEGEQITLAATVTLGSDTTITVAFMSGEAVIAAGKETASYTYEHVWQPTAGSYQVFARASDSTGLSSDSALVTILVEAVQAPTEPAPTPIPGVQVKPGDNVSNIISAHPAGTTFVFQAGVHRLSSRIVVRAGDTYVGEPGAVLSGARLLTSFSREGSYYVASGQAQQGFIHGSCNTDSPRCTHPEDLFFDDVPLKHVATLAEVRSGTWFFDYAADKIYFADNPSGRTVEASVTSAAFIGDASNVTIRNLTIEKFASPTQRGAIHSRSPWDENRYGSNWLIENNVVKLNHGVGIIASHGSRILNNKVLRNGQMGIGSVRGVGTLVEGNEIAYNNFAGYNWGWEAGGTKFVRTDGLVVRNNYAHSNNGPGLWTDISNIRTLYEYNLVENNLAEGIFHEISYSAVIRHNTIRGNGRECMTGSNYCHNFGAGINIYNSSNVEVYGNTLTGNYGGITGRSDSTRYGTDPMGTWILENLHVHSNTVELLYWPNATNAGGGKGVHAYQGVMGGSTAPQFSPEANNRYESNTYYATQSSHWRWAGGGRSFSNWQGYGHDMAGVMTTSSLQTQAAY